MEYNGGLGAWCRGARGAKIYTCSRRASTTVKRAVRRPPVLPRWALGDCWSRYHAYSAGEYLGRVPALRGRRSPFRWPCWTWTGIWCARWTPPKAVADFTRDPALFPDPDAFLAALNARGVKVPLNLHPADGVGSSEERSAGMALALGRDRSRGDPIPFDPTDRDFLRAYFDVLLHPLEEQGVDFWWINWQPGPYPRLSGVDSLGLLDHHHFVNAVRDGRRPLILSRYAGPGSHRYPVGFSGDPVISWASLAFQPEFTATAANIGYGWRATTSEATFSKGGATR